MQLQYLPCRIWAFFLDQRNTKNISLYLITFKSVFAKQEPLEASGHTTKRKQASDMRQNAQNLLPMYSIESHSFVLHITTEGKDANQKHWFSGLICIASTVLKLFIIFISGI